MNYLPMTTYESPLRQARGRKLNTIVEDHEETHFGVKSDSETDTSDGTIIGRPLGRDSKYHVAIPRKSRLAAQIMVPASPSDCSASSCSSAESGIRRQSTHSTVDGSDDGTVFSDSCPSLGESAASDPTTFATDSSRSSMISTRSSRNRYPTLMIPRHDSWDIIENVIKENTVRMSPAPTIPLSPAVLSALPKWVPAINAPPSLGDGSSVTSESPSVQGVSAPVTPDMRVLQVVENENWEGRQHRRHERGRNNLENDAENLYSAVPETPLIERGNESDWSSIVGRFPQIPGATPEEMTPITPDIGGQMFFADPPHPDQGVWLPPDALRTLENLIRERSPATQSETSMEEMQEVFVPPSRPRSAEGETPSSNFSGYSFSQLSIPSPGGFFSSLKAGSRHTWCHGQSKTSNPPSSTTAENFYNVPWNKPERTVETVVEVDDSNLTDGPPTARQPVFAIPDNRTRSHSNSSDDDDMYGPSRSKVKTPVQAQPDPIRYEYEEAYEDELNKVAEQNIDRTSTWLAAQTTYMSALRETNPLNDLSDPSAQTLNPSDRCRSETQLQQSPPRKTVHFLLDPSTSPAAGLVKAPPVPKDATLLDAYTHHLNTRKRLDPFLHATVRLDYIHSLRLTQQPTHTAQILGNFSPAAYPQHPRPKYSGPFSQNPRQTGIFSLTEAQTTFRQLEREQRAVLQMQQNAWSVDALRYLQGGKLLACPQACRRLSTKATLALDDPKCMGKRRLRVLDLGGIAACDWAWQVARRWPNVKVYSVITKAMAETQLPRPSSTTPTPAPTSLSPEETAGIAGPPNHRTISVPHLWALPFRAAHFDVVSARGLHALLKAEPVPGVQSIDEYDMTLKEVLRVLKPGGWFEFQVMDSAIVRPQPPVSTTAANEKSLLTKPNSNNPGARCEALSVEFGFQLKTRGYDREPTRKWLPRLRRLGFVAPKRAWLFLPMGNPPVSLTSHDRKESGRDGGRTWKDAPRPMSEVSVRKILDEYLDVEAVRGPVGGTREVADVCGLVGNAMWEGWVVKLRRECGREEGRLAEGLAEVIQEGREDGAGLRVLVGWARKPSRSRDSARISGVTELSPGMGVQRGKDEMGTIRILLE